MKGESAMDLFLYFIIVSESPQGFTQESLKEELLLLLLLEKRCCTASTEAHYF